MLTIICTSSLTERSIIKRDLLDSPEDPVSETDENRGETVEETVEMKDEEDEKDEKDEIEESSGIDLDKVSLSHITVS